MSKPGEGSGEDEAVSTQGGVCRRGAPGGTGRPPFPNTMKTEGTMSDLMGPLNPFVSCYLRTAINILNDNGFPLRAVRKLDPGLRP